MAIPKQSRHFLSGKTIFVVGGGIAGLAFAIGIHKQWDHTSEPPTVIVYDRDSPDSERWREGENYSLSISGYNDAGGLVALKKLGLVDTILEHAVARVNGPGSFKIWGPDWSEYLCLRRRPLAGLETASIRIVRKGLRRVLIEAVGACENISIQWDAQCLDVEKLRHGRLRVHMEQRIHNIKTHADCDLLIAADGASSRLRGILRPDDHLEYVGAVLRGGLAGFPEGIPKPVQQDWGFMISNTGVSCFLSPVDQNTLLWAVGHREDQPTQELGPSSTEEERRAVLATSAKLGCLFKEPFPTIVQRTDSKTVMCLNGRDKPPFSHSSIADMPVVFIGDSNHALSPFAGFGANLALCDAYDLAHQLCMQHATMAGAVKAYDRISESRARNVWVGSRKNLKAGHSTGFRYWLFLAMLCVGNWVGWIVGKVRK
ncbi:hypothetical protein QQS21_002916 [Conoideocrella luteorostrata]|uniref:FAD-binding domain-containing protein n=1 Tax=Conoideocrella luteorostrata TaxID=1105319 RepID=A0AAJ0G0Z9_9HYPO|nr:hypothetical protein QQS21_002916 [Conoideocrella luteorostrata]